LQVAVVVQETSVLLILVAEQVVLAVVEQVHLMEVLLVLQELQTLVVVVAAVATEHQHKTAVQAVQV
jgi:hypothetical protein